MTCNILPQWLQTSTLNAHYLSSTLTDEVEDDIPYLVRKNCRIQCLAGLIIITETLMLTPIGFLAYRRAVPRPSAPWAILCSPCLVLTKTNTTYISPSRHPNERLACRHTGCQNTVATLSKMVVVVCVIIVKFHRAPNIRTLLLVYFVNGACIFFFLFEVAASQHNMYSHIQGC